MNRRGRLASVARAAREIARAPDLDVVFERAAAAAAATTGSRLAALHWMDEYAGRLRPGARLGPSLHTGVVEFEAGEGLVGLAWRRGRILHAGAGEADARFIPKGPRAWTATAVLAAPLDGLEPCPGVLSVARAEGRYAREDGARLEILARAAAQRIESLRLRTAADTDPLTCLPNRRFLDRRLASLDVRTPSERSSFCAIFVDVDRFRDLNTAHGHLVGDQVLRHVAKTLRGVCRPVDFVARWGGEEFVAVLADEGLSAGLGVAERMRRALAEGAAVTTAGLIRVTASFGVAHGRPGESLELVCSRADSALYRAKRAGRNRVEGDDVRS